VSPKVADPAVRIALIENAARITAEEGRDALTLRRLTGSVPGILSVTATFVLCLATWASMQIQSDRQSGPSLPIAWAGSALGASVACALSGSALLGGACAALGISLLVLGLVAWRFSGLGLDPGAVSVACVVLSALVMNGYFFSQLPLASAILVALSLSASWVSEHTLLGPARPLPRALAAIAASGACSLCAVAVAWFAAPSGLD